MVHLHRQLIQSQHAAFVDFPWSSQRVSIGQTDISSAVVGEVEVVFSERIGDPRGRAELRTILRKDTLQAGPVYTYTFLTPHFGGVLPLHRRWVLDADVALIRNDRFSEYHALSAELAITHRFYPVFKREMTHAKFSYEAPIELRLGGTGGLPVSSM